jgi:hypothetical protein
MNEQISASIDLLQRELGSNIAVDGDVLLIGNARIQLPNFNVGKQKPDPLGDLKHAFPSKAHGDAREKLLYMIVQDASPSGRPAKESLDVYFRRSVQDTVPVTDALARTVLADAIRDAYWITPDSNTYPIPYHSRIPLSFRLSSQTKGGTLRDARYKLFPGRILPFMCWSGQQVDTAPIDALFDLLASEEGFSVLDKLALAAARDASHGRPDRAESSVLVEKLENEDPEVYAALKGGAFCPPTMQQFREDLLAVVSLKDRLPRKDVIGMLTLLLSFELAIYYYRVSHVLGADVDDVVRAAQDPADLAMTRESCTCNCPLEDCALAGRIKFRVGTGGDRPVSRQDPCVSAFADLDTRRLQPLVATIATANTLQAIWAQMGGQAGRPRLKALATQIREDDHFRADFDLAAAGAACEIALATGLALTPDEAVRLARRKPGVFALQETMLASKRRDLKYRGRDVVNQLVKPKASGGILIRTRGNVQFFEIDEDMLFLLVAVICRLEEMPFTEFLRRLRRYGLEPQDTQERSVLADALERLGMLRRYSDAGDSNYVRYPD